MLARNPGLASAFRPPSRGRSCSFPLVHSKPSMPQKAPGEHWHSSILRSRPCHETTHRPQHCQHCVGFHTLSVSPEDCAAATQLLRARLHADVVGGGLHPGQLRPGSVGQRHPYSRVTGGARPCSYNRGPRQCVPAPRRTAWTLTARPRSPSFPAAGPITARAFSKFDSWPSSSRSTTPTFLSVGAHRACARPRPGGCTGAGPLRGPPKTDGCP